MKSSEKLFEKGRQNLEGEWMNIHSHHIPANQWASQSRLAVASCDDAHHRPVVSCMAGVKGCEDDNV